MNYHLATRQNIVAGLGNRTPSLSIYPGYLLNNIIRHSAYNADHYQWAASYTLLLGNSLTCTPQTLVTFSKLR
ncbi:hypothetical protein IM043_gp242 [Bacillus phage SPG24]|uniref:hypothetical protein n=1 Tax=Bacillus phage SPG24 TaxID=1497851 RepID=UPI0022BA643A|nr:hypothetical protein IM043_gp242 [Bacillus phage SPG24]